MGVAVSSVFTQFVLIRDNAVTVGNCVPDIVGDQLATCTLSCLRVLNSTLFLLLVIPRPLFRLMTSCFCFPQAVVSSDAAVVSELPWYDPHGQPHHQGPGGRDRLYPGTSRCPTDTPFFRRSQGQRRRLTSHEWPRQWHRPSASIPGHRRSSGPHEWPRLPSAVRTAGNCWLLYCR